jgi:putative ABC transport system permease protein
LFIFEAGMLGLVGGVIGTITGVFFAWIIGFSANSYFQEKIFIIKPSIMLLIGATIFSFVMGIIFGILPAMQASKLKPVDSIRGGKS